MSEVTEVTEETTAEAAAEAAEAEVVLPSPTIFRVILKNACSYPVRLLIWMDEETGQGKYSVFTQFEKRELTINLLTFRHLQRDPKVRMTKIDQ